MSELKRTTWNLIAALINSIIFIAKIGFVEKISYIFNNVIKHPKIELVMEIRKG